MKQEVLQTHTSMKLYHEVCEKCSRIITHSYSSSFSLGIMALAPEQRAPIRNIYAFVRFADEIVDTFHDYDKRTLFNLFRRDTYDAIEKRISFNPVMHAFQHTVHEYQIPMDLIDAFLHSMEMDLDYSHYQNDSFNEYIYGSAEVVGLMCLKVFSQKSESLYRELVQPARKLGAAFQKINFLRDIKSDFQERGRVYFPDVDFYSQFNLQVKRQIEEDIEKDFSEALKGIKKLPASSRFGVYIAYIYFFRLLKKINRAGVKKIMESRVRVPNHEKIALIASSYVKYRLNIW